MAIPAVNVARAHYVLPLPRPVVGGLFAVADVVPADDPHLLLGVEADTDACSAPNLWSHACPPYFPATQCDAASGSVHNKQFKPTQHVSGDPFTVYFGKDCPPLGVTDGFRANVEENLRRKESFTVEQAVASLMLNMTKDDPADTQQAQSIQEAIGKAEVWLGENFFGLGLIHMNREMTAFACDAGLIRTNLDGSLVTCQGTPVANGAGYSMLNGMNEVVMASGRVTLIHGDIITNVVPGQQWAVDKCEPPRALAERTWVPLIECWAHKVHINTPLNP